MSASVLAWYPTLDVAPRAIVNLLCLRAIALTFRYRGITNRSTFHGENAAQRFPAHKAMGRGLACLLVAVKHGLRETSVLGAGWETGAEKADDHGVLATSAE